ncbi:MAG TPA: SemiSWEET transporter [Candidatus Omnitrophota bacterium]|nr:SemiSWEET transporter [Candidatus Omnitrophota bacterium]HPS19641.1 SemiSWEET transporter [Candidatus Omnitrophota bacterium]
MKIDPVYVDIIGCVAGVLTTISFIPQIIKVYKTRHVRDISLIMYSAFMTGIILWEIYGFMIHSLPVILANFITMFFCGAIVAAKIMFGENK